MEGLGSSGSCTWLAAHAFRYIEPIDAGVANREVFSTPGGPSDGAPPRLLVPPVVRDAEGTEGHVGLHMGVGRGTM